jgi:hypothetical protein
MQLSPGSGSAKGARAIALIEPRIEVTNRANGTCLREAVAFNKI